MANEPLIREISRLKAECGKRVTVKHVKGHAGHEGNEMADILAKQGAVISFTGGEAIFKTDVKPVDEKSHLLVKPVINPFIYSNSILKLRGETPSIGETPVYYGATYNQKGDVGDKYLAKPAVDMSYSVVMTEEKDNTLQPLLSFVETANTYQRPLSIISRKDSTSPEARELLANSGEDALITDGTNHKLASNSMTLAVTPERLYLAPFAIRHLRRMHETLTGFINGQDLGMGIFLVDGLFDYNPDAKIKNTVRVTTAQKTVPVQFSRKNKIDLHIGFDTPPLVNLQRMARFSKRKMEAFMLLDRKGSVGTSGKGSAAVTTHLLIITDGVNYIIHSSPHFAVRPLI